MPDSVARRPSSDAGKRHIHQQILITSLGDRTAPAPVPHANCCVIRNSPWTERARSFAVSTEMIAMADWRRRQETTIHHACGSGAESDGDGSAKERGRPHHQRQGRGNRGADPRCRAVRRSRRDVVRHHRPSPSILPPRPPVPAPSSICLRGKRLATANASTVIPNDHAKV
jgi:hypothetical protein